MKSEPKNTTHPDYACGCEADERTLLDNPERPGEPEDACRCISVREGILLIGHC